MIQLLFAQQAGGGAEGAPAGPLGGPMFPFFLLAMFGLFYFVVMRPMSRRQQQEQQKMLAGISRGSRVVTNAGIVGEVVTAKEGDEEIVIRSEDAKLRILRSAVVRVVGATPAEAAK